VMKTSCLCAGHAGRRCSGGRLAGRGKAASCAGGGQEGPEHREREGREGSCAHFGPGKLPCLLLVVITGIHAAGPAKQQDGCCVEVLRYILYAAFTRLHTADAALSSAPCPASINVVDCTNAWLVAGLICQEHTGVLAAAKGRWLKSRSVGDIQGRCALVRAQFAWNRRRLPPSSNG